MSQVIEIAPPGSRPGFVMFLLLTIPTRQENSSVASKAFAGSGFQVCQRENLLT